MRFGISIPAFADFSDPRVLAELAHDAESGRMGWFLHMGCHVLRPDLSSDRRSVGVACGGGDEHAADADRDNDHADRPPPSVEAGA